MAQAPTKKPAAPGSTPPQGPTNPSAILYPPPTKAPVVAAQPGEQMLGAPQTATNGAVATKGAVPVKVAAMDPGNQGTKNSHTQPGKIKPNGSAEEMREAQSVTSTTPLKKKPSSRVYPHLNN